MKALLVVLVCVVASRGAGDSSDAHYHARLRGYSWHTAQARLRPPGNISADFVIDPEQPRGAFAMGCSSQRVILRSSARSWHDMARSQTLTLGGRQPVTLHKAHLQRATASVYVNETVGVVLKIKFSSETCPRKGECVFVAGAVRGVRARLWQQDSRVVCGDAGLLCAAPGRVPDKRGVKGFSLCYGNWDG